MLLYLSILETEEEKSKFEKLYYQYRYVMQYVAYKILNDTQMAEDAVHEAFIRIAKNFHKVKEVDCPQTKGFVVIIVKNVALSMVKKETKIIEYSSMMYDSRINASVDIEDKMISKMSAEKILGVIKNLPDIYRDVLYLNVVEEYSINEITHMLNLSKETVKKRIQRGRKIIKSNL